MNSFPPIEDEDAEFLRRKIAAALDPKSGYTIKDFETEVTRGLGKFQSIEAVDSKTYVDGYDPKDLKLIVRFENRSTNPNPEFGSAGASGFDLRANLNGKVVLSVGGYQLIPTGLYFQIPANFEIQVRPRSGLAAKYGVTVLNSPGTIDSDYRGECGVILINHGNLPFEIKHGDRIAQAILAHVTNQFAYKLVQVDKILDDTERSTGGFGSTGVS